MRNNFYLLCLLLGFQLNFAQSDTVELKEAFLSGSGLLPGISTQSEISLHDSILEKSQPLLSSLLNFNTPIYFKETGAGMVASPSFRGTTASQTVVLWNGININSQTTGQTDFNTVNIRGFDKINVKGGGGNVAENNSSVGGSIELINELNFKKHLTNEFFARYGSFNTFAADLRNSYADENLSFKVGISRYSSDNDFDFPEGQLNPKNINGQFYQNNLTIAAGYKIDSRNTLKFFGNIFQARRNLSVVTPFATRQKYEDYNTRSLINWTSRFGKLNSDLKLAYLTEEYRFFGNISKPNYDPGEVKSFLAKYNLRYSLNSKIRLSSLMEFIRNEGFSGEEMEDKIRNSGALAISVHHQVLPKFYYELSVRQELSELYGNPLLYSLGGNWEVSDFYRIRFNTSKNFRIPTYNDLYWPEVGNPELKPETSYQVELGNEISTKNLKFSVTAYCNSVQNLIRWIPNANPLGGILWKPENVEDVAMYGIESVLSADQSFGKHHFSFAGTYAYTQSKDRKLKKQLIYVPYHKATASLSYNWNKFSVYYQFLFNGKVFTTTQNETKHQLEHYFLSNIGLDYNFGKEKIYKIGFEVLNLMDYEYQSVEARFMPGRNFHIYVNIKI